MNLVTDEKIISYIRKKISKANKIVAMLGIDMLLDGGGFNLDSNEQTYRIEETYGFSPEDILSTSYFNAKVEKFYRFYKNEILSMELRKTATYDALLKLEKMGKLLAVISQNYHGIPEDIHFKNVIELNGNINTNFCPRCNKKFDISYIKNSINIPQCDDCKLAVRPGIRLIGERVDAKALADANKMCEEADILLILGHSMFNDHLECGVDPEKDQLRVLFTQNSYFSDKNINYVIKDEIREILPLLIEG